MLAAVLLASAGCVPQQLVQGEPPAGESRLAEELSAGGNYAGAVAEYLRLASIRTSTATRYRVAAARTLLETGDPAQAEHLLVDAVPTGPADGAELALVRARIALARQQPADALARLEGVQATSLPRGRQVELHQIMSEAFAANSRWVDGARARLPIDALVSSPEARQRNHASIWALLEKASKESLEAARATPPDVFGGWVALALLSRSTLYDPTLFDSGIAQWRASFPAHPGDADIVPGLQSTARQIGAPARHVALLLPLSGRFANAGATVRDGFMSAWYADGGTRPRVTIHDADERNISAVYEQAIAEGADAVVGPLDRPAADKLVSGRELGVRTLVLNYTDAVPAADSTRRLYQIGLAPEDDARQVAERAWFAGHAHALAIAPTGEWGDRVLQAFSDRWAEIGGELLDVRRYRESGGEYSSATRALLGLEASERRRAELARTIMRDVISVPRRRRDADFIFMSASSTQARQIKPQLEYFFAGDLPVFATSHVYAGSVDYERDADLNGIFFDDLPWLIDPDTRDNHLYDAARRAWPGAGVEGSRLFALGVDAYRLLNHLARLQLQPAATLQGQTGALSVDARGRIARRLSWAQIRDGRPRALSVRAAQ